MKTITIRGIDEQLENAIKATSKKKHESMNQTILKLLKKSVGLSKKEVFQKHHDLDALAGTWSSKDEMAFAKNVQSFNKIDKEMWE